ncbi:nitroreductase [Streptomyces harbinensis]|uniref:Acg family FMN-binding oxidoreductase n=1 Tax=Streptomyces harbinensis TaxID=1176198 RepID=UPI0033913FB3
MARDGTTQGGADSGVDGGAAGGGDSGGAPDEHTVTALVAAAGAAPSMFNAQPWRFRYLRDAVTLQLRAALDRTLPHADPHGRALHLGCGAALFNLRVAAAGAGWEPVVTLLPDPFDPRLLATVRLAAAVSPDLELARLRPAIPERHSSRQPFRDELVPEPVRAALRRAAELEGAELHFPSAWHVRAILELVRDAEGRDRDTPARAEERERWTRDADAARTATDGLLAEALGPRLGYGGFPLRDATARRSAFAAGDPTPYEEEPQLALLGTGEDRPADWLRAGQAMERVLLLATGYGLSTGLTTQVLEWSELRWPVRDPESGMGQVQMVIRLGYGPPVPRSPRRPVDQILEIV